jgi:hypothetical protein
MKKIIDLTIIKAKFLIKLNQSPAFSENCKHNRNKKLFQRSSSIEYETEDDCKRRLHQWKAVQRSSDQISLRGSKST